MVNAMRVGLVTRWMGVLGIFTGILIFLPIGGATLEVVPAFWLVAMGILYIGKWPNGQPPAWESGEARPWPTRAQMREAASGPQPALATGGGDVTPAPTKPAGPHLAQAPARLTRLIGACAASDAARRRARRWENGRRTSVTEREEQRCRPNRIRHHRARRSTTSSPRCSTSRRSTRPRSFASTRC